MKNMKHYTDPTLREAGICRMIGKRGPRGGFVFIMQKTDGTVTVITLPARKEW